MIASPDRYGNDIAGRAKVNRGDFPLIVQQLA